MKNLFHYLFLVGSFIFLTSTSVEAQVTVNTIYNNTNCGMDVTITLYDTSGGGCTPIASQTYTVPAGGSVIVPSNNWEIIGHATGGYSNNTPNPACPFTLAPTSCTMSPTTYTPPNCTYQTCQSPYTATLYINGSGSYITIN